MLRAAGVGGDEGQVDLGLRDGGQLFLRLLTGILDALERHPVLLQVDARFLAELVADPVHYPLVDVVASEVRVAVGDFI
jgi:hypothetical protein